MKMYVFEGTPEEISKVAKSMQPMSPLKDQPIKKEAKEKSPSVVKAMSKSDDRPEKFVTTKFAVEVLTRLNLSDSIKKTICALFAADGDWKTTPELYEVSGYDQSQFAGMMGAFGRRMANTVGYDEEAHFFDYIWDKENKWWNYSLPPSVLLAVSEENICSVG